MGLFLMFMQAASLIPTMVMGFEKAFSGKKGSGKAKKKLLMDTTKAGLAASKVKPKDAKIILDGVSSLTDSTVAAINAVNALKKK